MSQTMIHTAYAYQVCIWSVDRSANTGNLMRHAILALLAGEPRHGYELKQAFEQTFGAAWPPLNIGQVYTTLGRLERDGLVTGQLIEQGSRPDKRVYVITEAGRAELASWIAEPTAGARLKDEFFTKLVLLDLPGVNGGVDRATLIARQRREYLQALRSLNDLVMREQAAGNGTVSLLIEGAILHLQADLRWLDLCEERTTSDQ
jgi:DNA-binding PadR family transcriptional regulator